MMKKENSAKKRMVSLTDVIETIWKTGLKATPNSDHVTN